MKTLSIDIETYNDVPFQKTGAYLYIESHTFEILLFAYSLVNKYVQIIAISYRECGKIFRKLHWNNRGVKSIVWRCISKLESPVWTATLAPSMNWFFKIPSSKQSNARWQK